MDDRDNSIAQHDEDDDFPPPRRRVSPMAIAGIIALIVLVIGGGIFAVSRFVGGQDSGGAIPTPTLIPGSNLFYVQTMPGWGTIIIDGQPIAHAPSSSNQPPLVLSTGIHQVVWRAEPFAPQICTIIVPPIVSETQCLASNPMPVNAGPNKGLMAMLITFTASLDTMSADHRAALVQTVQALLNRLQASDTVQPGEHYADLNADQFMATATGPLRATQHFQLDTDVGSPNSCAGNNEFSGSGCISDGQNCHAFCTVQDSPANQWDVSAIMKSLWDYTATNGQIVAKNQPDETDNSGTEYPVALKVNWDGSQWHVKIDMSGTSLFATPPSCDAAYYVVNDSQAGLYSYIPLGSNPYQQVYWNAQAASNSAAGCLLTAFVVTNNPTPAANPQPVARCLYRFGVLLTLDSTTHKILPALPQANAYEQQIAAQK